MRILSICAALLVLGGCASQDGLIGTATAPVVVASSNTQLTPQSKLVCHKEASIGSQMIHTVCETEQTDADRQAMQNKLLDNAQQNAASFHAAGGGH
ncbi:MAG: hypothetical protein ACJ8GJ_08245 [Vitreoscilla sp.]